MKKLIPILSVLAPLLAAPALYHTFRDLQSPPTVQQEIDAAAPGTTVSLPAGTYSVSELALKNGVSLAGAGKLPGASQTVLLGSVVIPDGCSGVTVTDIDIRSDAATQASTDYHTQFFVYSPGHADHITFRRCTFDQGSGYGAVLCSIDNLTLDTCDFEGANSPHGSADFDNDANLIETKCYHRYATGRTEYRFTQNALITGTTFLPNACVLPGTPYTETGGLDLSWSRGDTVKSVVVKALGKIDLDPGHNSWESILTQRWPAPGSAYWLACRHPVLADGSPDLLSPTVTELTVTGCTFFNSPAGLELYNGAVNCTVTSNRGVDIRWMYARADFNPSNQYPVSGCTFSNNTLGEPSGYFAGWLGITQSASGAQGVNTVAGNSIIIPPPAAR